MNTKANVSRNRTRRRVSRVAAAAALATLTASAVSLMPTPADLGLSGTTWAAQQVFSLGTEATGETPVGTKPWLTVAFLDQNTSDNKVWVAVNAKGLSSASEFVSEVAFNFSADSIFMDKNGKNRLDAGEWFAGERSWTGSSSLPLNNLRIRNDARDYLGGHIQGIPGTGDTSSKIVSVLPEPSEYGAMAGLGLVGFAIWRRRSAASPSVA